MAAPTSVLGQARAFARDFPRDRMPAQYLWDVVDYVPVIVDAGLTGRGGWRWGSTVMGGDATAGILAGFDDGDKLLIVGSDNQWYEIDQTPPFTATARHAAYTTRQNPVQFVDGVILPDATGANVPQLVTNPGGVLTFGSIDASAPKAPLVAIYKGFAVFGGTPGEEQNVRFSPPGLVTTAFDPFSFLPSTGDITALGALRSVLLIFHAGRVERARGSTPPHGGEPGDLFVEGLFDRVGCTDPRSVAYWNDNCVFADEHGVHVTDGSVIRNLVSQGGILYFWRTIYSGQISLAGTTFLDYYIITVRRNDGTALTLICDLNRRQWFRFANVYALSYVASSGGTGMERVWAGMAGTNRLARVGPTFFPDPTTLGDPVMDDDGTPVLPEFETAWYRLGREGRKRSRFAYLSYDARVPDGTFTGAAAWRRELDLDPEEIPPLAPPEVLAAVAPVLDVSFVTSPSELIYDEMGGMPPTSRYTRYKLPINRAPYGIAFRVKQLQATSVTRIYDLAVEGHPMEGSRE